MKVEKDFTNLALMTDLARQGGATQAQIDATLGKTAPVESEEKIENRNITEAGEGLTESEMRFILPEEGSFTLEDLEGPDLGPTIKVRNENSSKAMAATTALLSESVDAAIENFSTILQEHAAGEESQGFEQAKTANRESVQKANKALTSEILLDGSLSDTQKRNAMEDMEDPNSPQYNPNNMLSAKMLSLPSSLETASGDEQRLSMSDALQAVNESRAERQHLLNREMSKLDASSVKAYSEFVGLAMPFLEPFLMDKVYAELKKTVDLGDTDGIFENLAGVQKTAIKKAITNASPSKQKEIGEAIAKIVETHVGLPMAGGNDYAKFNMLNTFLTDEPYGATEAVIDSMIEVLDYTVIGGVLARPVKAGIKTFTRIGRGTEHIVRDAFRANARALENPNAPAKVVQDSNPSVARELHAQMASDETEGAAQALYGVSRQDAIVDDVQAQVKSTDGTVKYKVGDLDLEVRKDAVDVALDTGEIERTAKEKRALHNKYTSLYENVKGMSMRREMTQVGIVEDVVTKNPDGVSVDVLYGPAEGGFNNAQDAIDMSLWAMKDLGVTENNITLMQRVGDRYVPTTVKEVEASNATKAALETAHVRNETLLATTDDFLVQVKSEYKFKDSGVGNAWSDTSVKNNIFDRIGAGAGVIGEKTAGVFSAIQTYALDPASMIDPTTFKAASKGVARSAAVEKEILEVGNKFAKGFVGLGKKEQAVVEDIIKEANHKGIKYSNTTAAAEGLSAKQIQTLTDWKTTWDTIFVLENADAVRSLRGDGFKEFIDSATDTKLFAKPVQKHTVDNPTIYDQTTGKPKLLTNQELDELYEGGGTLARTRSPQSVGNTDYDLVLVSGKKGDAHLRELNNNSAVLQYREGYYSVKYKDRWFVDQTFSKTGGTEYSRAMATAPSKKEADLLKRRMEAEHPDSTFHNPRLDNKGSKQSDSDSWDMTHNLGRTTQRARGERLAGVSDMGGIDPSQANIMGPVESMLSSARSTANRVGLKKVIDTSKARFAKQHEAYMPVDPLTKTTQWPSDISGIKDRKAGTFDSKTLADARTEWNYINYLENGYINHIDELYRGLMNGLATRAGGASENLEKALAYMSTTRGPTGAGKNIAFNAYLALNPMRQAAIQGHQAVQLAANFPKELVRDIPTMVPILTAIQMGAKADQLPKAMLKAAGIDASEAATMYRVFKESGLVAQIDKQNLIRNGMSHLADQSTATVQSTRKVGSYAGRVVDVSRKVGFDTGENFNMMTAWLAHYGRAKRRGLDVKNKEVADNITAESINYTYNMNAAGDMRYNSDSLGLLFQFLQVPHKAFTQMAFNRVLTGAERGKLAAYNLLMYGIPSAVFYELTPELFPEDPDLQHAAVFGFESLALNKMLNDQVGTMTDFSSFSPTGAYGLYETVTGMLTTEISDLIAATPSGKLFIGSSPRITNAFRSIGRAFGLTEDFKETPTTKTMAGKEFLKIASGFSNVFKGNYMLEKGRTLSGLDLTVTEEDAFRTSVFGLQTADESMARLQMNRYFRDSKKIKDDVKAFYNLYKGQLRNAGIGTDEMEWGVRVLNEAFVLWNKEPAVLELVNKQLEGLIRRDASRGDVSLVDMIIKHAGLMSPEEVMAWSRSLPESDAYDKAEVIEMMERMVETNDGI